MKKSSIFDYNSDDVRSGSVELTTEESLAPEAMDKKRKARKVIYFLIVAVASVVLSLVLVNSMVDRLNSGLIMELQPGDIYPMQMEDGRYTGSFASGEMAAEVTVEISTGYISNISLNGFTGIDTSRAQRVFSAVMVSQSLDTGLEDVGSEPSDKILLMAIDDALNGEEEQ